MAIGHREVSQTKPLKSKERVLKPHPTKLEISPKKHLLNLLFSFYLCSNRQLQDPKDHGAGMHEKSYKGAEKQHILSLVPDFNSQNWTKGETVNHHEQ